jgi:hypothetical protein
MKFIIFAVLVCVSTMAVAQDEYFVDLSPQARALSKELKANAQTSPKRFDAEQDVTKFGPWFIGSCLTPAEHFHLLAYFSSPKAAYVAVFSRDKQLHALWKFQCDARQFSVKGTKLIFAARAAMHMDTAETYAQVPREVVIDFGSLPSGRTFKFYDVSYTLPE